MEGRRYLLLSSISTELPLILNDCCSSVDVVVYLLKEYDRRSQTGYSLSYQERGLNAQQLQA